MSKHTLWKTLSCDLTADEISTYSQELAIITTEQSEVEAEKKEVLSTFTARLNKCIADGRVLARKITTRKEDRQVECDLEFDYAKGMVYTIRTDTGVTIGQRKLSDEERQEWLDFDNEEGRKQEVEDKREELNSAPIIEGEILQIEHKPEGSEPEITVCEKTQCGNYDESEPNHCSECENVYECEWATSDDPLPCHTVDREEADRRAQICQDWEECEHREICFTPKNEQEGICFKDAPHRIPLTEEQQRRIHTLTNTSVYDCKISLNHCKDMRVLLVSLEIVTERGEKTKAKHISARINQLENSPTDGYEGFVSPEEKTEKDGIIPGRIETLNVSINDKSTQIQIYVAKGDSGVWYTAYHISHKQAGHSYYPYPKFSDKYSSRTEAIKAGCEKVYIKAAEMIKDAKPIRIIATAITDFLLTQEVQ